MSIYQSGLLGVHVSLSELLQLNRKSQNVTLEDLADQTGLSYGKIYRIMNGDIKKPDPEALKTIALVLNLDFRYLFQLSGYAITSNTDEKKSVRLPVLSWEYCYLAFPFMGPIEPGLSDEQFVCDQEIEDGFVLIVDEQNQCLPYYHKGDVLVCAPHAAIQDHDIVLYRLPTSESFLYGMVQYIKKNQTIMPLHAPLMQQRIYVEELLESPIVARLNMHVKL